MKFGGDIASVEIVDCMGEPGLAVFNRARRTIDVLDVRPGYDNNIWFSSAAGHVVAYARDKRAGGLCDGDWPWIVEQLVAEGVL